MAATWLEKPTTLRATRKLAKEFDDMLPCPNDRPMADRRYDAIKKKIMDGTFGLAGFASCFCKETNLTYRVNGKHTARVLSELDGEFQWPWATVQRWEADGLADVAALYSTFDNKLSSRTSTDINRIYAATNPALEAIPTRLVQLAVTGISFADAENGYGMIPAEIRAAKMLEYPAFVVWLASMIQGAASKVDAQCLKRSGIAAAMFKTWCKSQKDAETFWTLVRDGSGPSPSSPCRKLNKLLLSTSSVNGNGSRTRKPTVGVREYLCKAIYAWNAWRKSETLDVLKFITGVATPKVI